MKNVFMYIIIVLLSAALALIIFLRVEADAPPPELTPPQVAQVTPTPTPAPTPTPTPEPTPEPTPDIPDIDISSWEYLLVNTEYPLDSSYAPKLTAFENGQNFDSRAIEAMKSFIAAARAEGLSVYVTSSYRPYETQQYLFKNKVAQYGGDEAAAAKIVARPGTSEHQTGLAADIVDKYYQYMNESLADTPLSKWMAAHCAEYGFILRYPQDKQEITKIMYEPWHFRYVGVPAATYMMEHGICLEEFVALYQE